MYYCSETDNPGCDPEVPNGGYQGSVSMTRSGTGNGKFSAIISGLESPLDPSDVLNIRIVAADPDGIEGAPVSGTVQLAP